MSLAHIAHLTSAHPRDDSRIFHKQCRSLAAGGYDVTLVVADGKGSEERDGVTIRDVGRSGGRIGRMLGATRRVYRTAVALDAAIYHLHDPELIPAGLQLKRLGKQVIFDSHEDVPKQLLGKPYLGPLARRLLPGAFAIAERHACNRFDGIVAATPTIRDKFMQINRHTIDVNNFPLLGELGAAQADAPWNEKRRQVCYVGGIAASRGAREIVRACALLASDARLSLAGAPSEPGLMDELRRTNGWDRVDELGFVGRDGVREVMRQSMAGLVTLHPLVNYLDALPVKMFEYMAAGIPVIASGFPLWHSIVEGNDCGLCVDPLDPGAIAGAIDFLVTHPDAARRMGENGRRAVLHHYNWSSEEKKLCGFYAALA
jgi:glycosyltransferase involved in cell wall biosynthesis